MTNIVYRGMITIGFSKDDVATAIQALTRKDFYKSMTAYSFKFAAWQDVDCSRFKEVDLYIKFQINDNDGFASGYCL